MTYPHQRTPRNRLLRAIWWLGQTGVYFHALCGEKHVPGVCRDGVDRNPKWLHRAIVVVDYPPLVALFRLAAVAWVVIVIIWLAS